MKGRNVRERIYLTGEELDRMELDIMNRRHIERYGIIRQYCSGVVMDVACGCGYGSYLISKNPDVEDVIAFDQEQEAIEWAQVNFGHGKVQFKQSTIKQFNMEADMVVAFEIIEHLHKPKQLIDLIERSNAIKALISFPTKKTTHYNPHHYHDFDKCDIIGMFSREWREKDFIELHREHGILWMERD